MVSTGIIKFSIQKNSILIFVVFLSIFSLLLSNLLGLKGSFQSPFNPLFKKPGADGIAN